ncbi:MAG: T9SS type A sorting domain-containing protein [Aquaticitalea sp.]
MKYLYFLLILTFTSVLQINAQEVSPYLTGLTSPRGMAVHDSYLYFSETNGNISVADLTQVTPSSSVYITNTNNPLGLTFDGSMLYIADFGDQSSDTGRILRVDTSITSPVVEVLFSGLDNVADVKVYNGFLYCSMVNPGKIAKFDLSASSPTLIDVVPNPGSGVFGMEVYDDNLYFIRIEGASSVIYKLDLTDANADPIRFIDYTTDFDRPLNLRMIGSELYLPDFTLSKIFKIDLDQTNLVIEEVVSSGIVNPRDMVSWNQTIFISESGNNRISTINGVLGINDVSISTPLALFPNPTNDVLNVSNITEPIGYTIYNILGQTFMKGNVNPNEAINVSALNSGIYLLNFENGISKKFVKQ